MLRNRAKRKYGTVAQEIQFSEFYRTAIISYPLKFNSSDRLQPADTANLSPYTPSCNATPASRIWQSGLWNKKQGWLYTATEWLCTATLARKK